MSAAIVIPVHNRRETTLRCLRNLRDGSLAPDFIIIVVDDGSSDGTAMAIRAEFPEATLVSGDGELYWTGAIVRGMERAIASGVSHLFWLNDDCLPEPGALEKMLEFLRTNPKSICGASCYVHDLNRSVETGFLRRKPLKAVGGLTEAEGVCGYCVGMPVTLCREIGLPDAERMPHYAADVIYTMLAHQQGYRVVLLDAAKVRLLDEKTPPTFTERARAWHGGTPDFVRSTFFMRKSPFFLKGQYWYHRYKYGFLLGSLFFLMKVFAWSWKTATCVSRASAPVAAGNFVHEPTSSKADSFMSIPDQLKRFPVVEATYKVLCNFGRLNLPEILPETLVTLEEDLLIPMAAPFSADLDAPSADLFFLLSLARTLGARRILEVGTFRARTTCALKLNCPDATVVSYDIARIDSPYRQRLETQPGIDLRLGSFSEAGTRLIAEAKFDLIFVDGSHTYDDALADSRLALQLIHPNGFIVWHDYRLNIPVTHRIRVPEALDHFAQETERRIYHVLGTTCAVHGPAFAPPAGR